LRVVGPRVTEALISRLQHAYADDIRIHMADEHLGAEGIAVAVANMIATA
jgi:hypothetical protein